VFVTCQEYRLTINLLYTFLIIFKNKLSTVVTYFSFNKMVRHPYCDTGSEELFSREINWQRRNHIVAP